MTTSSVSSNTSSFNFELISPAKVEVRGFEERVLIPGVDGDFLVLAGHTRLITNLRVGGVVRVIRGGQDAHQIYVSGGYADISPDQCTILAPEAIPLHQIDKDGLEERQKFLETDLEEENDEEKIAEIHQELGEIELKFKALAEG